VWRTFKNAALPYAPFSPSQGRLLLTSQVGIALGLWLCAGTGVLPSPSELVKAWMGLVRQQGLLFELWTSVKVLLQALLISSVLTLAIATAATAPLFDALARFTSSLRFLGFAGLSYVFMLVANDAGELKLALLVFGITVMMVTAMLAEVRAIPAQAIEHCKTLGMRHWRISYELVVLGKAAVFLDLVRQNAAVGWTLLAMVEGLTRSEGGIGALLLNQNRYFQLSGVFAIQLTILLYGLAQDYLLGRLRTTLCPYVSIEERSVQ
jgi:ABC-type nitrate/sulfonate/bicarbonate transport system permease component